ncbi:hypothetical protein [Streptomyces sp. HB132]|uniref:hypothetical protein n=1 Tax=Streptomyces sp. HB132 TaxID=767388 RepID=UPI001D9148E7|nr:hypothetical protein [Streptomyces sp. HB132]MBM7436720.1 hypothetical protein [Streptomyces sp. HB132]
MSVDATTAVLQDVGVQQPASLAPLSGGTYNAVTRVTFEDGTGWVVKIPPAHSTGLSYERHLLVNEVTFYKAAAETWEAVAPRLVAALEGL